MALGCSPVDISLHLGNKPLSRHPVSLCSLGCKGNRICGVARWDTEQNACPPGVLDTGCILISALTLVRPRQLGQLLLLMTLSQSSTTRALNHWISYPRILNCSGYAAILWKHCVVERSWPWSVGFYWSDSDYSVAVALILATLSCQRQT